MRVCLPEIRQNIQRSLFHLFNQSLSGNNPFRSGKCLFCFLVLMEKSSLTFFLCLQKGPLRMDQWKRRLCFTSCGWVGPLLGGSKKPRETQVSRWEERAGIGERGLTLAGVPRPPREEVSPRTARGSVKVNVFVSKISKPFFQHYSSVRYRYQKLVGSIDRPDGMHMRGKSMKVW